MIKVTLDALAWKDVEPDVQALVDKWLVAAGDMVSAYAKLYRELAQK